MHSGQAIPFSSSPYCHIMSDCETEYEHGGYQRTKYYDSDDGMDREEQEWAEATEDAGELPEMVAKLSADTVEADR
jgi:hypothetical protein